MAESTKYLHVVSFQVPFPPDYGGAIDVFYRLKALKESGYKVLLHTFVYERNRNTDAASHQLDAVVEKVFYYERNTGISANLSFIPYIVKSRCNEKLISDLLSDDYPILFEGLHTCYYLADPRLAKRRKLVRMHNIEHHYYRHLYAQTPWSINRLFYLIEGWRLKRYEKILSHANCILAISDSDFAHFNERYGKEKCRLMPCFFDNEKVQTEGGTERYVLYHGNLAVEENSTVVRFLLESVVPAVADDIPFVIAGRNPSRELCEIAGRHPNVLLVANPDDEQMRRLVSHARVNTMLTFQPTGIKLKLLNTLTKGRGYCIANDFMLSGNELGRFCVVANTIEEIVSSILALIEKEPDEDELRKRFHDIDEMGFNSISAIEEK